METKHTPGPWRVGMRPGPIVYGPRGEQITAMHNPLLERDENMANARLIAAAPELLAACRELVAEFDREEAELMEKPGYYGMNETEGVAIARAALAKAGAL